MKIQSDFFSNFPKIKKRALINFGPLRNNEATKNKLLHKVYHWKYKKFLQD